MEEEVQGNEQMKNGQDPISGIFKGLIIVFLGVSLLLASLGIIEWSQWLAFFLFGLGCIFFIEVLICHAISTCRRPRFSKLIWGCVLVFIGGVFLVGSTIWWPFIIIAAGIAVLVRALVGPRR